jgi:hypothetical protein
MSDFNDQRIDAVASFLGAKSRKLSDNSYEIECASGNIYTLTHYPTERRTAEVVPFPHRERT